MSKGGYRTAGYLKSAFMDARQAQACVQGTCSGFFYFQLDMRHFDTDPNRVGLHLGYVSTRASVVSGTSFLRVPPSAVPPVMIIPMFWGYRDLSIFFSVSRFVFDLQFARCRGPKLGLIPGRGISRCCTAECRISIPKKDLDTNKETWATSIPQNIVSIPKQAASKIRWIQEGFKGLFCRSAQIRFRPECTAVAAIRLRMRMRILTRPRNSLANFWLQISNKKLRIRRCEGIR